MGKFEILNNINELELFNFLSNVRYEKFNLFPNAEKKSIITYLINRIGNIDDAFERIFTYCIDSEIIVLGIIRSAEWDSNHFGIKCLSIDNIFYSRKQEGKVLIDAINNAIKELVRSAIDEGVKFISTNISSEDSELAIGMQQNNFHYIVTQIDGVLDSKKEIPVNNTVLEAGLINDTEVEFFSKIAGDSYFKGGRFYVDRNFNVNLVNKMYSSLIRSSFENNDIMLVYRLNNEPLGLFICKKIIEYPEFNNLKVAPLRFLIVAPQARKANVGFELFNATINYLKDKSDIVTTGLEVNNIISLNLHNKLKFKYNYTHSVFHWWAP